jgi:hypothetical protein
MLLKIRHLWQLKVITIEMKGLTRCKLTIISESAVCKKFLAQIWYYPASLQISNSHSLDCMLLFKCFFVYIIDLKEYSFHLYGLY